MEKHEDSARPYPLYVLLIVVAGACLGFGYTLGAGKNSMSGMQHSTSTHSMSGATQPQPTQALSLLASPTTSQATYNVTFTHADEVLAEQPTIFSFKIAQATNGAPPAQLVKLYDKLAHLVIVDDSLSHYQHLHPSYNAKTGDLMATATLPAAGSYHLYLSYQPSDSTEQQVAFRLTTSGSGSTLKSSQAVDTQISKKFDNYRVTLNTLTYSATKLLDGRQEIALDVGSGGNQSVDLQPYLGALGHLVMINQKTYDYVHIHPLTSSSKNTNKVVFMPMGLTGSLKPGTYRLFVQMVPNGRLILADYTVRITN